MSLRGLLAGVAGALLALALMCATALVVITSRMGQNSSRLWQALESVRTVEQLEIALLIHSREHRLLASTGDPAHAAATLAAEQRLQSLMDEAKGVVGSPAEAAVLDDLQDEVTRYLRMAAQQSSSPERIMAVPRLVDEALRSCERLLEVNLKEARVVADETRAWDQLANILGFVVALVLLTGVGLGVWSVRRYLYRPLLSIRGALMRFHPGAKGVLAPETGPVELREIAREFNVMAERLERHREVQLRFIAGVAHDLRNPLSALKLSGALIRPGLPLPSEEKIRERFELVVRQAGRLERLVGDLLDTAQIEAGRLELRLEEHDLRALVQEALALHDGMSRAHELRPFLPDVPVPVRCDATRIAQVLNNLLSNAIKYSPQGGQVRIELTAGPEAAWVAVTDPGVGIPTLERESIFEPFRRSTNTRDTIPGVGLGLSVARRILEAHGGSIEVESTPDVGSTFRLRLPRPPGTATQPPAPAGTDTRDGV